MNKDVMKDFLKERIERLNWKIDYNRKELQTAEMELKMFMKQLSELELTP